MHGESRVAISACPTMDSCGTSVLTPCRKSSIAVLSPRLGWYTRSRRIIGSGGLVIVHAAATGIDRSFVDARGELGVEQEAHPAP